MLLITDCVKKLSLEVMSDVSFVRINAPMIGACYAYHRVCAEVGVIGAITGAAREPVYAKEPLHIKGLAWDFRSYIFTDPTSAFQRLRSILSEIDPSYRVVYIKPPKPVHFHVEWRGAAR